MLESVVIVFILECSRACFYDIGVYVPRYQYFGQHSMILFEKWLCMYVNRAVKISRRCLSGMLRFHWLRRLVR